MAELVRFTDEAGTHYTQKGSRFHRDYLRDHAEEIEAVEPVEPVEVKIGVPAAKSLAVVKDLELKAPKQS
jgi:hypothetical protein